MASMASRLLKATIPATAVVGSTMYLSSQPLFADDGRPAPVIPARDSVKPPVRPGRTSSGDKLPIYPQPDAEPLVTLIEAPHPFTSYIAQAREATTDAFSGAGGYVETGVSKWIGFERKVEKEVKTVIPRDESLTPGIIYILIAGLTGSVVTRTRSFPIRWLAPPLFTIAAAPYFLPKTSHNIRAYLSDLEDRYVPDIAASHDRLNHALSTHWEMAKSQLGSAGETARGWSQQAVEGVERSTGLKVGDAVRAGQEKVQRELQKVDAARRQPLERVGYVVEQRPVAEIVKPVDQPELVAPGKRMV